MSGLYLIQVTISICIMDGFDGQTLYEDSCNRVDEMNQRFNEAYGKIKADNFFLNKVYFLTITNINSCANYKNVLKTFCALGDHVYLIE